MERYRFIDVTKSTGQDFFLDKYQSHFSAMYNDIFDGTVSEQKKK